MELIQLLVFAFPPVCRVVSALSLLLRPLLLLKFLLGVLASVVPIAFY